jgi:mannose-6-phosphate isomerase-like protein (cupin superfamily)
VDARHQDDSELSNKNSDPVWAAFELPNMFEQREQAGRPWLPFLTVSTMTAGVYALPEAGVDPQGPHERDELYYVISGRAKLQVEGDSMEVSPGSTVYVRAFTEHRFYDIEEELKVLVFFSTAESLAD